MPERVAIDIEEGVADVRLNRPEKLNALDPAMFDALIETGKALAGEPSLRAVVLSGSGRAFCAGLDFSTFMGRTGPSEPGGGPRDLLRREEGSPANRAQRAAFIWYELPVPVIAALHGVAFGGGFQIAMAADIRFVAPDARLSVMEIHWGLIPDMSGTQMLRRLVSLDVAKELTFTGCIVEGREALALGLATHLSEKPLDAARALAREIAGRSPDAIRAAKRLLNRSGVVGLEEGLQLEEEAQLSLLGRPNQIEAVHARLEKREPKFNDPDEG
ncbi:MAG: crotonase/enoyl-CoA hydratase family protein [Myxococcota bacterium]